MSETFDLEEFEKHVLSVLGAIEYYDGLAPTELVPASDSYESGREEAERFAADPTVKKIICRSLASFLNDTVTLANTVTGAAIVAAITPTLSASALIPLNPILYAWIAFIILKSGVSGYCQGIDKS